MSRRISLQQRHQGPDSPRFPPARCSVARRGCHGSPGQSGGAGMPGLWPSCWSRPALPGEGKGVIRGEDHIAIWEYSRYEPNSGCRLVCLHLGRASGALDSSSMNTMVPNHSHTTDCTVLGNVKSNLESSVVKTLQRSPLHSEETSKSLQCPMKAKPGHCGSSDPIPRFLLLTLPQPHWLSCCSDLLAYSCFHPVPGSSFFMGRSPPNLHVSNVTFSLRPSLISLYAKWKPCGSPLHPTSLLYSPPHITF